MPLRKALVISRFAQKLGCIVGLSGRRSLLTKIQRLCAVFRRQLRA
jgi:hypothetical protein